MNRSEILDFFLRRRSIRRFQKKPIPEEDFNFLMKVAMSAPSGNNAQPWEFIIVQDPTVKEKLSKVHPWVAMAAEAPAAIVILGDKNSKWWEHDCAAATENLLLGAAQIGLGAVWCGITEDQAGKVRSLLHIPEQMGVLAVVPIGFPAEIPPPHTKYRTDKVHKERYSK